MHSAEGMAHSVKGKKKLVLDTQIVLVFVLILILDTGSNDIQKISMLRLE